ncbi:MAG: OmpA family protein [Pseudomonadota bacterium]
MKTLGLTALVLMLLPAAALADGSWSYSHSPHDDARWHVGGDRLECRMSQTVPGFGRAVFRAGAGDHYSLEFRAQRDRASRPFSVRLTAEPPSWRADNTRPVARKRVQPQREQTVIAFEGQPALRTLYEMERGMNPTLTFLDWVDGSEQINVSLSARSAGEAIDDFQACMASLHPDSFDDVATMRVAFGPMDHLLDDEGRDRLDRMLAYAEIDPTVQFAILAGHTDDQGPVELNEELAQMRVDAVRSHLVEGGFPEDRIVELAWGSERPAADNDSPEGRAENRRVEVELRRGDNPPR